MSNDEELKTLSETMTDEEKGTSFFASLRDLINGMASKLNHVHLIDADKTEIVIALKYNGDYHCGLFKPEGKKIDPLFESFYESITPKDERKDLN